jgi:hypothetical protein
MEWRTAGAVLPWLIASVIVTVTLNTALASRALQAPTSPATVPPEPSRPSPAKSKPLIESWEKVTV